MAHLQHAGPPQRPNELQGEQHHHYSGADEKVQPLDGVGQQFDPGVETERGKLLESSGAHGLCRLDAHEAEEKLAAVLQQLGSARPRNRMLHLASLAEARIGLGEMDGAAEATAAALDLAIEVGTPRGWTRMRELRNALEGRPSVSTREVLGRLRVLTPT